MSTVAIPEKQATFREQYKAAIAKWYNGWGHLLSIFVPGVAVVAFCVHRIHDPTIWELLLVVPVRLWSSRPRPKPRTNYSGVYRV